MERTYLIGKSRTAFLLMIRLQQQMQHGIKQFIKKFLQLWAQMVTWFMTFLIRKQGCRGGFQGLQQEIQYWIAFGS
ncbi:hypothetical protein WI75_01030 [Burkholderia ubonensis]|nr:hypothetical protein WI75_01030 [Burkholderia ubonensis]KVL65148.1 hypothetical protein WJ48_18985 [Burkholderia ubonensis]KVL79683.1 hypothetical protein WJ49_07240 [Burkholderia ubonensis]